MINGGLVMSFLSGPMLWIGLGLILFGIIIVASVVVGKKRSKELDELNQFFPDEDKPDTSGISVEKVRRTTRERERKRQRAQHLPEVDEIDEEEEDFISQDRVPSSLIEHKLERKKEEEQAEINSKQPAWQNRRKQHQESISDDVEEMADRQDSSNDHQEEEEFVSQPQPGFARRRFARANISDDPYTSVDHVESDSNQWNSTPSSSQASMTRRLYKQNLLSVDSSDESTNSSSVVEAMETVRTVAFPPNRVNQSDIRPTEARREMRRPRVVRETAISQGPSDGKSGGKKKRLY